MDPHLYQELVGLVEEWQRRAQGSDRPFLYYSKSMDYIMVYDGRDPQAPTRQRFDWPAAGIIEACNEAGKSRDQIRVVLKEAKHDRTLSDDELNDALSVLTSRRILYEEREKYFTLAIPENQFL